MISKAIATPALAAVTALTLACAGESPPNINATPAPTPTVMFTPTPSLTPADKARWVEIAAQMFYFPDNNPLRRDERMSS